MTHYKVDIASNYQDKIINLFTSHITIRDHENRKILEYTLTENMSIMLEFRSLEFILDKIINYHEEKRYNSKPDIYINTYFKYLDKAVNIKYTDHRNTIYKTILPSINKLLPKANIDINLLPLVIKEENKWYKLFKNRSIPTFGHVYTYFDYDIVNHKFYNDRGMLVGYKDTKRNQQRLSMNNIDYHECYLTWILHCGHWPERRIIHINYENYDNNIQNLDLQGIVFNKHNDPMRHKDPKVIQAYLKLRLKLDYTTHQLIWKPTKEQNRSWNVNHAGKRAGTVLNNGYRSIHINTSSYLEHRLMWLYVYGEWPKYELDHLNRKRDDNRITNLREATSKQNGHNRISTPDTSSQYKNVHWEKRRNKWVVSMKNDEKELYLGQYNDERDAGHGSDFANLILRDNNFTRLNFPNYRSRYLDILKDNNITNNAYVNTSLIRNLISIMKEVKHESMEASY